MATMLSICILREGIVATGICVLDGIVATGICVLGGNCGYQYL